MRTAPSPVTSLPLRAAFLDALSVGGLVLLSNPKRLLAHVIDVANPDDGAVRIFEHNCDPELLEPLAKAARNPTPQALEEAATKVTLILTDGRILQEDMSKKVACELVFGLSAYLRVMCPERIVRTATQGYSTTRKGDGVQKANEEKEQPTQDATQGKSVNGTATTNGAKSVSATNTSGNSPSTTSVGSSVGSGSSSTSAGSSTGASSGSSATASGHNTRSGGTANTTTATTALDFSSLSKKPLVRERQAEEAGLSLKWFRWIKISCVLDALFVGLNANYFLVAFGDMSSRVGGTNPITEAAILGGGVTGVLVAVLAVMYLVALYRLSAFKVGAPRLYLGITGSRIILTLFQTFFIDFIRASQAGNPNMLWVLPPALSFSITTSFVPAIFWFVNRAYLKKREGLFNL